MSQVTSPLLGLIADHYGSNVMAYLMVVTTWTGLILFIFAVAYVDALLYPSFICLGLATWMGAMLTVKTGMMFAEGSRTRSRVIIALNALFDAGSMTYLILWGIGQVSSLSLTTIATAYFLLSLVLYGGGAYFWMVTVPEVAKKECRQSVGLESNQGAAQEATFSSHDVSALAEHNQAMGDELFSSEAVPQQGNDYELVCERTQRQQLSSMPFLFLLVFWTIHVTSNQWVLTTTRDFLAYLGDDETGNKYLTIFTLLMPVSLVAVPFTDETLDKIGFGGAFQVINILALGYNLVRLLATNLNVQIFGFILYSFFRSFLFGICLSYAPALLAPKVVGKATGIMFMLTGVTALANIPLSNYAIEKQDGDFFIPNLIYTCLIGPCVFAAWKLGKSSERERHAKAVQTEKLRPSSPSYQ